MEVRKLINNNIFYSTKENDKVSFMVAILNKGNFPGYGFIGTMKNRFAFMPAEGKLVIADRKMSFDNFSNKTKTYLLPHNDIYYLYTFYETVRLGFIGKAAMTIAYEVAMSNIKDNVFSCDNLNFQLFEILKDLEEPLPIAFANEMEGNAYCPICSNDNVEKINVGKKSIEFKCNVCNITYKYYYDRKTLTVPAITFADVFETLNESSSTFSYFRCYKIRTPSWS